MLKKLSKNYLFLVSGILILFFSLVNQAKAAAPSPISDLFCRPDTSAGAVWLSWTVPSGLASSSAYEVKYVQGNTIDYGTANTYNQNWPSGAASIPKEELMTGLNPGTQFTFAMKSRDESGNWSGASNPVICTATKITQKDTIPPTSKIDVPLDGSTILKTTSIIIKGTASDSGGSSVQKVEISFDKGTTWSLTQIKDVVNNDYLWEYVWQNPSVGEYNIKIRATDWVSNTETPGNGIIIKIVTQLPSPTPTSTPTPSITPGPNSTPTPKPTFKPSPVPSPTQILTSTPVPTPTPTITLTPTPSPEIQINFSQKIINFLERLIQILGQKITGFFR